MQPGRRQGVNTRRQQPAFSRRHATDGRACAGDVALLAQVLDACAGSNWRCLDMIILFGIRRSSSVVVSVVAVAVAVAVAEETLGMMRTTVKR